MARLSYMFLAAAIGATFFLRWHQSPEYPMWLWASLVIAIAACCALMKVTNYTRYCIAALLGVLLALVCMARTTHVTHADDIEAFADGKKHILQGTIVDAPDRRQLITLFTVEVSAIDVDGEDFPVRGTVLVTDRGQWPEHAFGERVLLRGALERPKEEDGFSYADYLSLRDIYAIMPNADIQKALDQPVQRSTGQHIFGTLFALREQAERQIALVFPEPHASLMAGLLTGWRGGLPEKLTADFRTSGLSHIVAISGYNITIIIVLIDGILFFLPRKWRLLPEIVAIVLFTLFVGASASVVRAALMGILGLFALHTGRTTTIRLTILWTALLMLCVNPKQLWFDAGFQLSFLAVIGLSEISPLLMQWFKKIPDTLGIRTSIVATTAAQIATFPVTVFTFGQISLIAPVANLLIAPLVPLAMAIGALSVVLSTLWVPLGLVVGYCAWGLLELMMYIAHLCALVPGAAIVFTKYT